jgi:hypothetical protein
MKQRMTCGAQRDQVLFGVIASLAAEALVVNFQVHHAAAVLASPAIPP